MLGLIIITASLKSSPTSIQTPTEGLAGGKVCLFPYIYTYIYNEKTYCQEAKQSSKPNSDMKQVLKLYNRKFKSL